MATSTSTRKLHWTQEDLNIPVSMVTDRWSVIKGKFTPGLTIKNILAGRRLQIGIHYMFIVTD
jgi:hypothetical protein